MEPAPLAERVVGVALELDGVAAAPAAVGGDEHPGARVLDPVAQRVGGEAAEDDRVRGSDAGAGEHRDGELGDHRHVDRHAVAPLDAERAERVGATPHLLEQLARR